MKALLREVLKEVLEGKSPSFWAQPLASAQKAGKATGRAIPAAVWWRAAASGSYGYRKTATASSPPHSSSDPSEATKVWVGALA